MARVNRTNVIQKAVNDLAISLSSEKVIPNETLDKIQLVYSLNSQFSNIVRSVNKTTTGTSTVYTLGSQEDFYLTSIQLSATQDATCDGVLYQVTGTVDGVSRALCSLRVPPLTAQGNLVSNINFSHPIKIDPNTTISIVESFSVGTSASTTTITGFKLSSN